MAAANLQRADYLQHRRAVSVMYLAGAVLVCAVALNLAKTPVGLPLLACVGACLVSTVVAIVLAVVFCLKGNVTNKRRSDLEWCCIILGLGCVWGGLTLFLEILPITT